MFRSTTSTASCPPTAIGRTLRTSIAWCTCARAMCVRVCSTRFSFHTWHPAKPRGTNTRISGHALPRVGVILFIGAILLSKEPWQRAPSSVVPEHGQKAKELGVVFACDDLYAREFELLEDTLDSRLPPYFDGDYWPSEAERVAASPPKRGRKEANTASASSAKFRKRVSESVKSARESLFVIALQPTCAACKQLIVNAAYWQVASVAAVDTYYCSKCQGAAAPAVAAATATAAVQDAALTEVSPTNFAETCCISETEEPEMSCPFLDCRPNMLKNCEEHHYQFDSFRRAKYSTMMLVYQISSTQRSAQ